LTTIASSTAGLDPRARGTRLGSGQERRGFSAEQIFEGDDRHFREAERVLDGGHDGEAGWLVDDATRNGRGLDLYFDATLPHQNAGLAVGAS
jgi:hypothetical protein